MHAQQSNSGGPRAGPSTSPHPALQDPIVLETPFNEHSLQETTYLLRFVYVPTDLTPANLEHLAFQEHPLLPGVLELAHKLDIASVLAVGDKFLAGKVGKMEDALQWLALADACHLSTTWAEAIRSGGGCLDSCS